MHTTLDTLYGIKIILHNRGFAASDGKVLYFHDGLTYELMNKYRQYFRYRASLFQVKYPKQYVEVRYFSHAPKSVDAELQFTKNKLRAAKAKLTEWTNKVAKYKLAWCSLYPIDDDPAYKKACSKIEKQKNRISELQNELLI